MATVVFLSLWHKSPDTSRALHGREASNLREELGTRLCGPAPAEGGVQLAKSSRQTFKKRQREMNKKQKKADKAKRLSARKGDEPGVENEEPEEISKEIGGEGKPKLKVFVRGSSRDGD